MTKSLRIHLFGPFEISLDDVSLTNHDWRSQQTQTIGKVLLSRRGKVVTSDQLIETLWPNDPVETARRRLHVRINQLRNGLQGKSALVRTVHNGYIFEPDDDSWIDVDEFQTLITEGAHYQEIGQGRQAIQMYEKAYQVYRGDFLAEDLYSDWTYTHREFYRERFLSLLIELSECYAQQGRYRLAIARARQALIQDPLRETIYVRLMLYHYYSGEQAQALRTYQRCKEVLLGELGVAPLESTSVLLEQIKLGTLWKSEKRPQYPPPIYEGRLFDVPYALKEIPFAGREREYAWLVSKWKDPETKVILLEGEAGIGKSRLLDTFAGYIKSQDARYLHIRLSISENTPMQAVITALRDLLTENTLSKLNSATLAALAVLFPEIHIRNKNLPALPTLTPEADQLRLQQALSTFAILPEVSSTLIIVDDAHRLSADALVLLKFLSQNLKVLLSFRGEDTPADHPLRTIVGETSLKLKPLSATAIQSIIRQLSGDDQPTIAAKINAQSGGNPLFIVSLVQHMFESGQLYVDSSETWQITNNAPPSLPETLRQTIEMRLLHLNRSQRQILDYAAVMGGNFNFKLLKTALQQLEEKLLKNLDELIDAALIIEPRSQNKPEFMISHDRYTEVAYETIPPVRRRLMHRDIAQAIEHLYDGQLADHFAALADHYDRAEKGRQAAHYAALAGEKAAARFAVSEALHFLDRALALLPEDEIGKQAKLRLIREKVYSLQGMRQPQRDELVALETLSPQLPTKTQAEIYLRRAAYEWIMENYQHEKAAVACAIQKAQSCHAKDLEARAYFLLGQSVDDMNKRLEHLKRAQKLAYEAKDLGVEADVLRWLGNTAYWQNRYAESMDYMSQALSMHREVGDLRGELSALNNIGHLHKILGNYQEAATFYEQAHEICQKINDKLAEGVILTNLGGLTLDLGDFDTAQNALNQAAEIRAEIGNEEGLAMAENLIGNLFRQLGFFDQSLEHYQIALGINTRIDHEKQTCETLNGLSALYRELGDFDSSRGYLEQSIALNTDKIAPRHIQGCIEGSLLEIYNCDPHRALSLGEEALALSSKLAGFKAAAHKNIGHALFGLGRMEDAQEHFTATETLYRQLDQAHLATEPLAGLAMIALARQDQKEALSSIERILQTINEKPLLGPDRPFWIYLTAYRVLSLEEDQRAFKIIEMAYTLILQRSETIQDEDLRKTYLGEISENREIAQIYRKISKSH